MQYQRSIWCLLFIAFAVSAFSAPAHAVSNLVSWVSGSGSDASSCSRTAPCASFAGAIQKTQINGEIRCVDTGDFGLLMITQSVTIDCHDAPAFVHAASFCFYIQLLTSLASDPAQTVKIRGVTCDGLGGPTFGIAIDVAAAVFLEDMVISDHGVGSGGVGVIDRRTHGGVLFIRNSVIRNCAGPGIIAGTTGGPYGASIDNVHSLRNAFGIAVAVGN